MRVGAFYGVKKKVTFAISKAPGAVFRDNTVLPASTVITFIATLCSFCLSLVNLRCFEILRRSIRKQLFRTKWQFCVGIPAPQTGNTIAWSAQEADFSVLLNAEDPRLRDNLYLNDANRPLTSRVNVM